MKKLFTNCPVCDSTLNIGRYDCPNCRTSIEGKFKHCSFCKLSDDDRLFTLVFLQTEGNMKDVERVMNISYPTIKSRLARVNKALSEEQPDIKKLYSSINQQRKQTVANDSTRKLTDILNMLESGEIAAGEAIKFLRGETNAEVINNKGDNDNDVQEGS
ncbi:MAG TPA: DUF2089 domain-containing protein [Firmicutes bacterium]|nr:DUF2089 domain-containing protein [Bacillota bacterium]